MTYTQTYTWLYDDNCLQCTETVVYAPKRKSACKILLQSHHHHHHHHPNLFEQAWINPQQRVRPLWKNNWLTMINLKKAKKIAVHVLGVHTSAYLKVKTTFLLRQRQLSCSLQWLFHRYSKSERYVEIQGDVIVSTATTSHIMSATINRKATKWLNIHHFQTCQLVPAELMPQLKLVFQSATKHSRCTFMSLNHLIGEAAKVMNGLTGKFK